MPFSSHIVYVDESGDHNLTNPDPDYPMFVLAFCIFDKEAYTEATVTAIQRLKFKYFGHDMVILHEREIRKAKGAFSLLQVPEVREEFMADMNGLVEAAPFTLVASVIDKNALRRKYIYPGNPYHLAMAFGLERVSKALSDAGVKGTTHCVFEMRGQKEDSELELAFRRVCDGDNYENRPLPLSIVMAPKSCNSAGLQIADMVARPIGRHLMNPEQPNRAYEILRQKYRTSRSGDPTGYGLKVFP